LAVRSVVKEAAKPVRLFSEVPVFLTEADDLGSTRSQEALSPVMISAPFNRLDYPSLRQSAYLNQASLGLISQPAVTAMHTFIDNVARHGNLYMSDSDEVAYFETLRERASRLLHCDSSRVAIVASASEILGQIPMLLQPKLKSTILAVSSDFPAITRPWLRLAALRNHTVRFVDDQPSCDLTDTLIEAIDESTSVVAVSSVQYATGTVVDISRLRQSSVQVGARLIVDATQAAGATRVDAAAWDADAVITSGYKWLGGHGGIALAVMSPLLLEQIPPLPGWMGATDPFGFDATTLSLANDARRYTQSTMSYVSMAGLVVAIEQLLSLGEAGIEAHAQSLAAMLVSDVSKYGWQPFRGVGDPAGSPHIISLGHPSESVQATVERLRTHNIVCGTRGGRIRISLAPYNDESDVNAVSEALAGAGS
jgi:selenocysteine lyase/cysteine desulfurase